MMRPLVSHPRRRAPAGRARRARSTTGSARCRRRSTAARRWRPCRASRSRRTTATTPLAAYYLALDWIPREKQKTEGPRLARRLRFVLDRAAVPRPRRRSARSPRASQARPGYDQLGTIPLETQNIPIRVSRYEVDGKPTWVFSPLTVRAVDALYDAYGPPLGEVLPEVLFARPLGGLELWQWLGLVLAFIAALLGGWALERVGLAVLGRLTRMTRVTWDDQLVHVGARSAPAAHLGLRAQRGHAAAPAPAGVGARDRACSPAPCWSSPRPGSRCASSTSPRGWWRAGWRRSHENVANARAVRTQLALLRRVLVVVVWILAVAALLMQFTVVRTVGVSLLASAGVAGVVLGLAAQKSIGALLAGIQLSITQPIRIGDSVLVEGEFGTVEEISLTYVVVRTWDLRRLLIPVTQFLEKPFQNWSKGGVEMLGPVILQVDWTTDLDAAAEGAGPGARRRGQGHVGREAGQRPGGGLVRAHHAAPGAGRGLRRLASSTSAAWCASGSSPSCAGRRAGSPTTGWSRTRSRSSPRVQRPEASTAGVGGSGLARCARLTHPVSPRGTRARGRIPSGMHGDPSRAAAGPGRERGRRHEAVPPHQRRRPGSGRLPRAPRAEGYRSATPPRSARR